MDKNEFLNRVRILFSIDGYELEEFEFSEPMQEEFIRDPVLFLLRSDDERQDKIWSIIERRHADAHPDDAIAPIPAAEPVDDRA